MRLKSNYLIKSNEEWMNEDIFSITFFSLIFSLVARRCLSFLHIGTLFDHFWSIWYLSEISMVPYLLQKQETDRELFFVDLRFFWTREQNCDLLHFVGFFHVASLFSTRIDNKKALELDNRIIFSYLFQSDFNI